MKHLRDDDQANGTLTKTPKVCKGCGYVITCVTSKRWLKAYALQCMSVWICITTNTVIHVYTHLCLLCNVSNWLLHVWPTCVVAYVACCWIHCYSVCMYDTTISISYWALDTLYLFVKGGGGGNSDGHLWCYHSHLWECLTYVHSYLDCVSCYMCIEMYVYIYM